jgi:predicted transcriptional regulator
MQMVPVIGFTDMNSFMRFLSNNGLVEQKNGSYQITDKGQSFLAYISGRKYAIYKAG